jgi:hypothetical protein
MFLHIEAAKQARQFEIESQKFIAIRKNIWIQKVYWIIGRKMYLWPCVYRLQSERPSQETSVLEPQGRKSLFKCVQTSKIKGDASSIHFLNPFFQATRSSRSKKNHIPSNKTFATSDITPPHISIMTDNGRPALGCGYPMWSPYWYLQALHTLTQLVANARQTRELTLVPRPTPIFVITQRVFAIPSTNLLFNGPWRAPSTAGYGTRSGMSVISANKKSNLVLRILSPLSDKPSVTLGMIRWLSKRTDWNSGMRRRAIDEHFVLVLWMTGEMGIGRLLCWDSWIDRP